jgi:hypothetical protein
MKQREPFYSQADIILDTSSLKISQVVRRLAERLQEYGIHL